MKLTILYLSVLGCFFSSILTLRAAESRDASSARPEGQLPTRMHSRMSELPRITVGQTSGDLVGKDNRALQAAVDYIAALGGGVIEIGPGEYLMNDSLHVRSHCTVRGTPGQTILRKAPSVTSALALDGDYGEEQITLENPQGFEVGRGVTVWDSQSGGFHTTVARITGGNGKTFSISLPLNADCMVGNGAKAATVFPVVSGCHIEGARIEQLIIDGNREHNVSLNGCRGAGIFLYRGFGTVISKCTVRNFNGDGISFQQSNDVTLEDCVSEGNAALGLHPGSGSQRPVVRGCLARDNGEDGLFLCWRVQHGLFESNTLENNGRYGISIGHKDSDNLLLRNTVKSNKGEGIYFRNESLGMAGHRNRLEENLVENNGAKTGTPGVRIRGETHGVILRNNVIRDTREQPKQGVGILVEEKAGEVVIEDNKIEAEVKVQDRRARGKE